MNSAAATARTDGSRQEANRPAFPRGHSGGAAEGRLQEPAAREEAGDDSAGPRNEGDAAGRGAGVGQPRPRLAGDRHATHGGA